MMMMKMMIMIIKLSEEKDEEVNVSFYHSA
jgi:hypothetical protein